MPRSRRLRVAEENVADHEKSCEDWSKLKMEVLKLKCNQYGLVSTGKKAEVQHRLMAHFHTNHDNDDDVSIITAIGDVSTHVRVEEDNCILEELRALRSEIGAMKQKQQEMGSLLQHQSTRETLVEVHAIPASIHCPIIPTIADMTDNHMVISQDHHDNIQNIQPVHSFQLPPFMNNSNAVVNTGMFSSNLNELHSSSDHTNPFIPPPLPVNILKKIEKDDFVSFEDLLPSTPSTATTSRDEHFIDIDIESSASRLRQKEKSKRIINLSSWMLAWNNFMQTTLHFKPGRYFVLFCYQKIRSDSMHVTGMTKTFVYWWHLKVH